MEKAVATLTCDPAMVQHLFDNYDRKFPLYCCVETRVRPMEDFDFPEWVNVIDSEDVNKKFKEVCDSPFVDEYTMGMNVLLPWYLKDEVDRLLFVDDDVILGDLEEIFESEYSKFHVSGGLTGWTQYRKCDDNYGAVIKELGRMIGVDIDDSNYKFYFKDTHVYGGHKFYSNDFDFQLYENDLKFLFESELIRSLFAKKRTYRTYYIDERFDQFAVIHQGMLEGKEHSLNKYVQLHLVRREKVDWSKFKVSKPIFHNASVSHKQNVYAKMIEDGHIV